MGPVLSFGASIAPGGHEGPSGLFCPLEASIPPGGPEELSGCWASFVLWKQGFRLENVGDARARGPHLSFGTKIAPGGHEGQGGLIVLWKQGCVWRP